MKTYNSPQLNLFVKLQCKPGEPCSLISVKSFPLYLCAWNRLKTELSIVHHMEGNNRESSDCDLRRCEIQWFAEGMLYNNI